MVKVNWTPQSIVDLESIAEYISKDSLHFARIQVARFLEFITILESNPMAGRVVPEFGIRSIREIIVGNYRIVYRLVSKTQIDILTVHHSARKLRKSFIQE